MTSQRLSLHLRLLRSVLLLTFRMCPTSVNRKCIKTVIKLIRLPDEMFRKVNKPFQVKWWTKIYKVFFCCRERVSTTLTPTFEVPHLLNIKYFPSYPYTTLPAG